MDTGTHRHRETQAWMDRCRHIHMDASMDRQMQACTHGRGHGWMDVGTHTQTWAQCRHAHMDMGTHAQMWACGHRCGHAHTGVDMHG
jgi:hypothetical protein